MKKIQRTSVHLADGMYAKLQYIAEAERQTLEEQLYQLMRNCISAYEAEHGKIMPKEDETQKG